MRLFGCGTCTGHFVEQQRTKATARQFSVDGSQGVLSLRDFVFFQKSSGSKIIGLRRSRRKHVSGLRTFWSHVDCSLWRSWILLLVCGLSKALVCHAASL